MRSADCTRDSTPAHRNASCNASFNGNSINFYHAAGGCVNTAYSTVVSHEYGHWLNQLYGTGNGSGDAQPHGAGQQCNGQPSSHVSSPLSDWHLAPASPLLHG